MPKFGEIAYSKDIGYKARATYVWLECSCCGKGRWVRRHDSLKQDHLNLCRLCSVRKTQSLIAKKKQLLGYPMKHAHELGFKSRCMMYFSPCLQCGKERWVQKTQVGHLCASCRGREHSKKIIGTRNPHWKGGRYINSSGYVFITVSPSSPYYPMAAKRNHKIPEHRLIVAQHLKRCLKPYEVVHHINGNKSDNRLENLQLLPEAGKHTPYTRLENRIKELEARITILEAENVMFKKQLEKLEWMPSTSSEGIGI